MLKHCQYFVQPLSSAVSRRNKSFNNCPSASLLTRKYLLTCACAAQVATFTVWGRCFSFRASNCAALFEGSIHLKKYSIFNNAISVFMVMYFHCNTQFFLPSLSFPVFPTHTGPSFSPSCAPPCSYSHRAMDPKKLESIAQTRRVRRKPAELGTSPARRAPC